MWGDGDLPRPVDDCLLEVGLLFHALEDHLALAEGGVPRDGEEL